MVGKAENQEPRTENEDTDRWAISFFGMRTRGIGMDAALRQSGAGSDVAPLASVTVRPVPAWLAFVWGRGRRR